MEERSEDPKIDDVPPGQSRNGQERARVMWERVRMGWAMVSGSTLNEVEPGREREEPAPPRGDEPRVQKEGFVDEAIPWLDAVYRFAFRLTGGDRDGADDLVQLTFLRAHRFWDTYERGTNVKSWLFTICRNAYLQQERSARNRRERPEADYEEPFVHRNQTPALSAPTKDPSAEFFDDLIEDDVIRAIEELPEEFREVLILSDMGDLTYQEISTVLDIPIGTTKSRLFRARRILQERLRAYAIETGHIREESC